MDSKKRENSTISTFIQKYSLLGGGGGLYKENNEKKLKPKEILITKFTHKLWLLSISKFHYQWHDAIVLGVIEKKRKLQI